ncbi:hypothetical protein CEXT_714081 [Caerostris extrusa]|uniref:Uncharacterized protein n=1 Tax=Caerostris extrusa TaxID=172846 RepID=A0AAV4N5H6_CAEEX|nr:hypothetical protein CEXT_714081 [Caerostris extrusa]
MQMYSLFRSKSFGKKKSITPSLWKRRRERALFQIGLGKSSQVGALFFFYLWVVESEQKIALMFLILLNSFILNKEYSLCDEERVSAV